MQNLILQQIKIELSKAKQTYEPMNSFHESYAIIKEELDEYWDEVKKWPKSSDMLNMRKELIQIAAMCVRSIEDMDL